MSRPPARSPPERRSTRRPGRRPDAARPQAHNNYSEKFYILEGQFTVWAGGRTAVLRPGDVFTVPAGTAHAVAVTGGRPGRALAVASPSGLARLVMGAGTPDTGDGPPAGTSDLALFARVCAEVGDEALSPPRRPAGRARMTPVLGPMTRLIGVRHSVRPGSRTED